MVTPLKEKDPFLGLDPQFDNAGQAVDSDPFAGLDPQFDNVGQAVDSDPFQIYFRRRRIGFNSCCLGEVLLHLKLLIKAQGTSLMLLMVMSATRNICIFLGRT